jgi:hypothetical protein
MGNKDWQKKMADAEERRRSLTGTRVEKIAQHNKAVEMRKSSDSL